MKTILLASVMLAFSTVGRADVPDGPDAVNGSFARMLAHGRSVALAGEVDRSAGYSEFERIVNAAARGDLSRVEAVLSNSVADGPGRNVLGSFSSRGFLVAPDKK